MIEQVKLLGGPYDGGEVTVLIGEHEYKTYSRARRMVVGGQEWYVYRRDPANPRRFVYQQEAANE